MDSVLLDSGLNLITFLKYKLAFLFISIKIDPINNFDINTPPLCSVFNDKSIALIDSSTKIENDKTWSFWEQNNSSFSHLAYQSWQHATIYAENQKIMLNLKSLLLK